MAPTASNAAKTSISASATSTATHFNRSKTTAMPRQDDSRQSQPAAPVSRRDALRSIPAITPGVTYREDDDGHVLVQVPVPPRRGFLGFFQTARHAQSPPDSIGAFVIKQIDAGASPTSK